jgi:hypothetical protein
MQTGKFSFEDVDFCDHSSPGKMDFPGLSLNVECDMETDQSIGRRY